MHAHIIPNIVKISLKRVEMNFCPESKNSIIVKTARYDRIINELCHFYKVPLIKTGLMFHKYHLLNQLQVFMRYKKLPKSALISLVNFGTKKNSGLIKLQAQYAEPVSFTCHSVLRKPYTEPSIDASYQFSFHLAMRFRIFFL